MTFKELRTEIYNCIGLDFQAASSVLQEKVFALSVADTLELISEIGAIPEDIVHDSTEEKLYTKVSDILLAKSLMEMNIEAKVLTQRGDCADVVAQSRNHKYSLVGDAKAFRLSRTAKNVKDYKIGSMDKWRGDCDYSVLVCPYFQYPKNKSQIYKDALNLNVSFFSWEYLYILLKEGVKESPSVNLSQLWNQSAIIGRTVTVENSKNNFLNRQDVNLAKILNIPVADFCKYFDEVKKRLIQRGNMEIKYYEQEMERVKSLDRDTAISEFLKSMKLDSKIITIKGFIDQISNEDD